MNASLETQVVSLIAQLCTTSAAEISPAHRLREDLNMDSVSSMELLSLLAEELDLDIEVEEAATVATVRDAIEMARRHLPGPR
jgi:acyl carrier protein